MAVMSDGLVHIPLCRLETYFSPIGELKATPARVKHWESKFNEIKSAGHKIPVPWGHSLSALPHPDTVDDQTFEDAKWKRLHDEARGNASYVEKMYVGADGKPYVAFKPPPGYRPLPDGSLENESNGTRISEISGAFGNWSDGTGKRHKDILLHVALCTRPVVGGQSGFHLEPPKVDSQANMLSSMPGAPEFLFTMSSGASMKDEDVDDEMEGADAPAEDEYTPDEEAPEPAEDVPVEAETEVAAEPIPVAGKPDKCEEARALCMQAGLQIPECKTPEDFIQNLIVAMTTAIGLGAKFGHDNAEEDMPAAPATATTGPDAAPTPEAPPMMMSTIYEKEAAKREQKSMRREFNRVWEENRQLGCPPAIVDEFLAKESTIMLSVMPSGRIKMPTNLAIAKALRRVLKAFKGGAAPHMTILSTAVIPDSPAPNTNQPRGTAGGVDPDIRDALRSGAASTSGARYEPLPNGNGKH